jgi:hypothetical protein
VFDGKKAIRGGIPFVFRKCNNPELEIDDNDGDNDECACALFAQHNLEHGRSGHRTVSPGSFAGTWRNRRNGCRAVTSRRYSR